MSHHKKIPDLFETYPGRSAAWIIHEARIVVRVPQYALDNNLAWLDSFSGSEERKRAAQYMATVPMSIIRMARMFNKGVDIAFPNEQRPMMAAVYRVIHRHLIDWSDAIEQQLTRKTAPEEDLKALDVFASSLWEYARHYVEVEESDSGFLSKLAAKGFTVTDARMGSHSLIDDVDDMPRVSESVHNPIADNISLHIRKKAQSKKG